jgi:mannosyltransferase OCH1-like enzyme
LFDWLLRSLLVFVALVPSLAQGHPSVLHRNPLLPPYDQKCDQMHTSVAPIVHALHHGQAGYFNRPIERHIHQIWLGDPELMDRRKVDSWRAHAAKFGYNYTLWTEEHLGLLKALMPPENFAIVEDLLRVRFYAGASDVIRTFVLEFFGGIYADVDIKAPEYQNEIIDIASIVPLQNIVFMSEHHGRDVGNNLSVFVANGLMMSSAHHPLMKHFVETVVTNMRALTEALRDNDLIDVPYATGPFFINKSLAGPITVLPITFLEDMNMVD